MEAIYTKKDFDKEYRLACKNIKQANKGLPFPVKINKDYEILFHDNMIGMRISYLDGDVKYQTYNIAM